MKFVAILSAALLPALAMAEEDSTTTCVSTTTMTKTVTMTNAYTTSVYAEEATAAVVSSYESKPTIETEAEAPEPSSSPVTVQTAGASSMFNGLSLAAFAGSVIVIALF